jgi:hypothetical protein
LIDPMLVILAPPALVFGWAMLQMHKADNEAPDPIRAKLEV